MALARPRRFGPNTARACGPRPRYLSDVSHPRGQIWISTFRSSASKTAIERLLPNARRTRINFRKWHYRLVEWVCQTPVKARNTHRARFAAYRVDHKQTIENFWKRSPRTEKAR